MAPEVRDETKETGTYEAGCHCGYITFAVTLSPPLSTYEVNECNCSMCKHAGYLLTYPERQDVKWVSLGR